MPRARLDMPNGLPNTKCHRERSAAISLFNQRETARLLRRFASRNDNQNSLSPILGKVGRNGIAPNGEIIHATYGGMARGHPGR